MNVYIFESWHDVPFQVDDRRASKSSNDQFQLPVNIGRPNDIWPTKTMGQSQATYSGSGKYIIKEIFFYRARTLHIAHFMVLGWDVDLETRKSIIFL